MVLILAEVAEVEAAEGNFAGFGGELAVVVAAFVPQNVAAMENGVKKKLKKLKIYFWVDFFCPKKIQ